MYLLPCNSCYQSRASSERQQDQQMLNSDCSHANDETTIHPSTNVQLTAARRQFLDRGIVQILFMLTLQCTSCRVPLAQYHTSRW